jgi:hypothetical protein
MTIRNAGNTAHTLEHIQTDTTQLVNVGMVDLCQEANLWWCHRVVVGEKQLKLEDATCILSATSDFSRLNLQYLTFVWRLGRAVY